MTEIAMKQVGTAKEMASYYFSIVVLVGTIYIKVHLNIMIT